MSDRRDAVDRAGNRWNRIFDSLSAVPRRRLLSALQHSGEDEGVPLPEGVTFEGESQSLHRLELELRHVHLPKLAEAGYVRWEHSPLFAYRGCNFDEIAAVCNAFRSTLPDLPAELRRGCEMVHWE